MGDYPAVFLIGLLGSLHCVGMCGGFVMACSMKCGGGFRFSIAYNAGRVSLYSILGLIMGLLGKSLMAAGLFGRFQNILPVAAGVAMILIGIDFLGLIPQRLKDALPGIFPRLLIDRLITGRLKQNRPAPFLLGMLNGLIPCGFLYAAGIKAAAGADAFHGLMVMASFGAGTFAPMLFAGSLMSFFTNRRMIWPLSIASSIVIIALGVKAILHNTHHIHMLISACHSLLS